MFLHFFSQLYQVYIFPRTILYVFIRTTEPGFPLRDVDLLLLYLSVLETARVPVALIQLPLRRRGGRQQQ